MKLHLVIILSLFSLTIFSQNKYERYHVKTGKVVYKIEKNKETTIKTIIFKDWGAKEFITIETTKFTNKKKDNIEEKTTKVSKLDKAIIYTVDDKEKQIYQAKNYYLEWQKDKNLTDKGQEISKDWGGEKIGEGKILGYNCEIWKLKGITTYYYKGVPMKSDGRSDPLVATEAKFDIPVTDEDVALPDYPILNVNPFQAIEDEVEYLESDEGKEELREIGEAAKNMSWEDWYRIYHEDDELKGFSEEEIKEYYNKKKDEHIEERIEERKNDHLNKIPHWPSW